MEFIMYKIAHFFISQPGKFSFWLNFMSIMKINLYLTKN